MATRLATATANAMADAIDALTNTGGAGKLRIYTGSQPATPETAASGTLLVEFTLQNPAFSAASAGIITLAGTPLTVNASNTGTAGWFRIVNGAGDAVTDGTVGLSGEQINLNTTACATGVGVTVTSGTIAVPTS
jgi:hypothetical protein